MVFASMHADEIRSDVDLLLPTGRYLVIASGWRYPLCLQH